MKSAWIIEWENAAVKEFKKLGKPAQQKIVRYLETRIATEENPRRFGEPLIANRSGEWRYRVENYRIICKIEDETITVLVLKIGHRKDVYQ